MKGCVSKKLVWLFLAVALTWTVASAASAQPGEFVKGVLQPLADGWPNGAINIIVVDDPGSRDDLYAKSIQAAASPFSPVRITASCEPAAVGGTWYTLKEVPKRDGGCDGYYPIIITPFGVVTDLLVEPGTREIGAKLENLKMVIGTDYTPYFIIQRKNAPWGPTWDGMVKWAKANPGKLRYISYEVASGHDITVSSILYTLGLKVEKIPQGTIQECASTVGAGLGDFTLVDIGTAITNSARTDITVIMGDTIPEAYSKNKNIVSGKQAGIDLNPNMGGVNMQIGVPGCTPQSRVDWLFKLFKAAALSPIHQKRAQVYPGLQWRIRDGAFLDNVNRENYKFSEPILHATGLHMDDRK